MVDILKKMTFQINRTGLINGTFNPRVWADLCQLRYTCWYTVSGLRRAPANERAFARQIIKIGRHAGILLSETKCTGNLQEPFRKSISVNFLRKRKTKTDLKTSHGLNKARTIYTSPSRRAGVNRPLPGKKRNDIIPCVPK